MSGTNGHSTGVAPTSVWNQDRPAWRRGRLWTSLLRAKELQRANRLFGDLTGSTRVTRPLFGATMHLDLARSSAQQLLYLMGERFVSELSLIQRLVKPGMRIVDVGGNIGYHALMFEQLIGSEGEIICIEPSPENLPELRANITNNAFSNIELHEVAVGASAGEVRVRGGINSGIIEGSGDSIGEVPLRRLSDLVAGRPVDFVKIDVDGYEDEVLAGAVDLLDEYRPIVLLEIHPHLLPRFGTSTRQVIDRLAGVSDSLIAFDQVREEDVSRWERVARRYWPTPSLREIDDVDAVIGAADNRKHDWTFWVIAVPSGDRVTSR